MGGASKPMLDVREALGMTNAIEPSEIERAIEIVTYSRSTHQSWIDYINAYRGDPAALKAETDIAGDLVHHAARVERYDHVLSVLQRVKEQMTK